MSLAAVGLLASTCGAPTSRVASALVKNVTVHFKMAVNGQALSCLGTYTGVGNNPDAGAQVYRPSLARFYVYDVRLVDSAGSDVAVTLSDDGAWQLSDAGVVMINGENGGSCAGPRGNLEVVGALPPGAYHGLKFRVGLPEHLNHLLVDALPSPLNQSAMYWSWTSGYRFLRVEGFDSKLAGLPGGLLHLGATACALNVSGDPTQGASCTYPNSFEVAFSSFEPETNTVVFDIGTLFKDTDLAVNAGGVVGCMSALDDPECPPIFRKLGLPYGEALPDGGLLVVQPATGQTVFTVE